MDNQSCQRSDCSFHVHKGLCANRFRQGMIELIKQDADKGFEDLEFLNEEEGVENLGLT